MHTKPTQMNKIQGIGAGYVGGPTMAVIARQCPDITVTVVDISEDRIAAWNDPDLDNLPIYEPGLAEVVGKARDKNLFFSEVDKAIQEADIIFIAVNTPTKTYGKGKGMAADLTMLSNVPGALQRWQRAIKSWSKKAHFLFAQQKRFKPYWNNHPTAHFEVLSNPEFLAEGTAVADLFKSDWVYRGSQNN